MKSRSESTVHTEHSRLPSSSQDTNHPTHSATARLNTSSSTNRPRWPRPGLARLAPIAHPLVLPAQARVLDARVRDGSAVTVVPVDPGHDLGSAHIDVGEGALPRHLRAAVAARAVDLADIGHVEVLDGHGAAAVVLQDLVVGVAGAAAVDVAGARGLLEGRGVFADVGPPAVLPVRVAKDVQGRGSGLTRC